jgi:hypothetical protein
VIEKCQTKLIQQNATKHGERKWARVNGTDKNGEKDSHNVAAGKGSARGGIDDAVGDQSRAKPQGQAVPAKQDTHHNAHGHGRVQGTGNTRLIDKNQ